MENDKRTTHMNQLLALAHPESLSEGNHTLLSCQVIDSELAVCSYPQSMIQCYANAGVDSCKHKIIKSDNETYICYLLLSDWW